MTFNPHTSADRAAMLDSIGVPAVDDLFAVVPERVRYPTLQLPPALTEMEAQARLSHLAGRNLVPAPGQTFLGAGSYHHYVPATVGQIVSRGEYYTAYTPYQPEVAQGTLQTIYEFQTLVAELFGLEVANASLYDGATALAEGALMSVSSTRTRKRIVVAGTIHPSYREVLRTYLAGLPVELVELPLPATGYVSTVDDVAPALTADLACLIVQYPNFFGAIEDVEAMAAAARAAGGILVAATYPVPLALLRPPGALGADVVAAEGQALGIPQSYGGPYVGLLAARQKLVRQMPGRLAGMTRDGAGNRGFVLTLQTREQHIRREKATSNICTNQGLMAATATVYMATLGPEGFREVARRCYHNAHYLAARVAAVPGYELPLTAPFFHEFVIRAPVPAAAVNEQLLEHDLIGGYDLRRLDPRGERDLLICATELHDRATLDRFVAALPTA